jgi:Na+/melibiose symporter-like transporter
MIAESIDYHEALFGTRKEGLLSAGVSLATKVGMAIGTAGIAFTLDWGGYQPGAVTEGARDAIRWSYYAGAVLLLALQALVVLFWPMDGQGTKPAELRERSH